MVYKCTYKGLAVSPVRYKRTMMIYALAATLLTLGAVACSSSTTPTVNVTEPDFCHSSQMEPCMAMIPANIRIGVPRNKKELDTLCSVYNNGMGCMDAYAKRCVPTDRREDIERDMSGGRALMKLLCGNGTAVRKVFLKESKCWGPVTEGWTRCSKRLHTVVADIVANAQPLTYDSSRTQVCCTQAEYMRCVERVGRVCSAVAAGLLRRMAWVTSKDIANCDHHLPEHCGAPHSTPLTGLAALAGMVFLLIRVRLNT